MLCHSQFDATRQYLNALHLSALVTVTMTTTSILHIFWNYLLVTRFGMDIAGIGMATMISYSWNLLVITIICYFNRSLKGLFEDSDSQYGNSSSGMGRLGSLSINSQRLKCRCYRCSNYSSELLLGFDDDPLGHACWNLSMCRFCYGRR